MGVPKMGVIYEGIKTRTPKSVINFMTAPWEYTRGITVLGRRIEIAFLR